MDQPIHITGPIGTGCIESLAQLMCFLSHFRSFGPIFVVTLGECNLRVGKLFRDTEIRNIKVDVKMRSAQFQVPCCKPSDVLDRGFDRTYDAPF